MKSRKVPLNFAIECKRHGGVLYWTVNSVTYKCQILPQTCPLCKVGGTLVGLPKPIRDEQNDGTNIVCFPPFGGCNTGFQLSIPNEKLSTEFKK